MELLATWVPSREICLSVSFGNVSVAVWRCLHYSCPQSAVIHVSSCLLPDSHSLCLDRISKQEGLVLGSSAALPPGSVSVCRPGAAVLRSIAFRRVTAPRNPRRQWAASVLRSREFKYSAIYSLHVNSFVRCTYTVSGRGLSMKSAWQGPCQEASAGVEGHGQGQVVTLTGGQRGG